MHAFIYYLVEACYVPIKPPLSTYSFLEEIRVCAGWDTIDLIVRAHNTRNLSFLDAHPEWYIECVLHVLLANLTSSYPFPT